MVHGSPLSNNCARRLSGRRSPRRPSPTGSPLGVLRPLSPSDASVGETGSGGEDEEEDDDVLVGTQECCNPLANLATVMAAGIDPPRTHWLGRGG
jgi:hypothetical protein